MLPICYVVVCLIAGEENVVAVVIPQTLRCHENAWPLVGVAIIYQLFHLCQIDILAHEASPSLPSSP